MLSSESPPSVSVKLAGLTNQFLLQNMIALALVLPGPRLGVINMSITYLSFKAKPESLLCM